MSGFKPDISLHLGDCLDILPTIPDGSVDMVLCDLPYGTTACKWDVVLPFAPLWSNYERIIKQDGAIVLFSTQPFTTKLIYSRISLYRYSYVWIKEKASNFQLANIQPLRRTEDICVFSLAKSANGASPKLRFFPILQQRNTPLRYGGKNNIGGRVLHSNGMKGLEKVYTTRHPSNILEFSKEYGKDIFHPTQKPVALCEYLIKTYTNEGDTVLDNCMGSGTTGVACINLDRGFIGIEKDPDFFGIASKRIQEARSLPRQGELAL